MAKQLDFFLDFLSSKKSSEKSSRLARALETFRPRCGTFAHDFKLGCCLVSEVIMEEFCSHHGCEILYVPPLEGTADKIRVEFSPNFNRKIIADIEPLIEKNWLQLKKELGDKLYNDDKFRIHSIKETEGNIAVVEVGITDYKSYVGTNMGNDLNVFVARGMEDFCNKKACVSDALGVGSIVLTADNYLLLVRRSFEVAEGQGMTDFPGGHAEPKALYSSLFTLLGHFILIEAALNSYLLISFHSQIQGCLIEIL